MKSSYQKMLALIIPCILPLLLGIVAVFLFPSYSTPEKQASFIEEQYPTAQILSRQNFEKYTVYEIGTEDSIGYALYQKVLGRWIYDHDLLSSDDIAIGDFYMGDTMYHAVIFRCEGVHSVQASYVNPFNSLDMGTVTTETHGRTMLVLPAEDDDFIIGSIKLLDESGNTLLAWSK